MGVRLVFLFICHSHSSIAARAQDVAITNTPQAGTGFSGPELFVANLPGTPLIGEFNLGPSGANFFPTRCLTWVSAMGIMGRDPGTCSNVQVSSFVPTSPMIPTAAPTAPLATPAPSTTLTPTSPPVSVAPTTPLTPVPTTHTPTQPSGSIRLNPQGKRVVYIDVRDVDWNNAGLCIRQAVDGGYNVVIMAFWLFSGPADLALVWTQSTPAAQQATVAYLHARNAVLLVSLAGSTESPYAAVSGAAYGVAAATWALQNGLDGVDFDMENLGPGLTAGGLTSAQTIQWLIDASNAARSILGPLGIVTHAPQAPYFGAIGSATPLRCRWNTTAHKRTRKRTHT